MKAQRERYISASYAPLAVKEGLYAVYGQEKTAIFYLGKRTKPEAHLIFPSLEARDAYLARFVEKAERFAREKAERKAAEKAARAAFTHGYALGDILVSSWGYEQTNLEFFEVVGVPSGKSVLLRPVASRRVRSTGWASADVAPAPGQFTGEAFRKLVAPGGAGHEKGVVRINSFANAYQSDPERAYHSSSYA